LVDILFHFFLCLQVFDTDVNPTTAMNVEDIKKLFKNNYMDPKVSTLFTPCSYL